jgi:hypothetical protein
MGAKKTPEFSKIIALDELIIAVTPPINAKASENIRALLNGQEYLQKVHDEAFALGFEKGCEASKKVAEL